MRGVVAQGHVGLKPNTELVSDGNMITPEAVQAGLIWSATRLEKLALG